MSTRRDGTIARQLRTLFRVGTVGEATDRQLLERFATGGGEPAEMAFATLVERHGPMVSRVCRAVLRDEHDAQDAAQATFLVLTSKARSLWVRESIGPWLHAVAYRVSCRARTAGTRRRRHERAAAELASRRLVPDGPRDDLDAALHEEIARLPERFRAPIVLCDLEGRSLEQAARHLGCPVGTVKSRLSRGRDRLRQRLGRRGLAPLAGRPAPAIPPAMAAFPTVPDDPLASAAVRRVLDTLAQGTPVPEAVNRLSEEVLRMMFLTKLKAIGAVLVASAPLVFGGVALTASQDPAPPDEAASRDPAPPDEAAIQERRAKGFERARREQAELERLVGTWARVSQLSDGRAPFSEARRSGMALSRTFRDDHKVVVSRRDTYASDPARRESTTIHSYSINPEKAPKELSIFGEHVLWQAIYELEGDTLRIAFYGRSEVDRPRGFSEQEAGPTPYPLIVETLKRVDEPTDP